MKGFVVRLICVVGLVLTSVNLRAQVMETKTGVDTLTFAERVAVRTNAVDWFLLTPNIGFEFDLRNTNWSRWTIGANFRFNWQTSHTYRPGVVYNILETRGEIRNYWHTRQITDLRKKGDKDYLSARPEAEHTNIIDKLFSMRRKNVKHYTTTYYRGFYAAADKFSVKLGHEGKEGTAFHAGVTYGIIRPLYVYENGNSIDLEFGISGGLVYTHYGTYVHNRANDCYQRMEYKDWHVVPYPVVTEVKVGFVYRFGKYPITKRYRWRYDVDTAYTNRMNDRYLQMHNDLINNRTEKAAKAERRAFVKDSLARDKKQRLYKDSVRNVFLKDSVANVKRLKFVEDSLRRDSADAAKELKKMEKLRQDSIDAVEKLNAKRQASLEEALKDSIAATDKRRQKELEEQEKAAEKARKEKEKADEKARKEREKAEEKARKEQEKALKKEEKEKEDKDEEATALFRRSGEYMLLTEERRGRYV